MILSLKNEKEKLLILNEVRSCREKETRIILVVLKGSFILVRIRINQWRRMLVWCSYGYDYGDYGDYGYGYYYHTIMSCM